MNVKTCNLESCFTVKENVSVVNVAKLLKAQKLRYVFVVDNKEYPIGIISVSDVSNRCVAEGKNPNIMTAKEIMTHPIEVVDDDDEVKKAYHIMLERNVFSVPVINDGKVIGLITFDEAMHKYGKIVVENMNGGKNC